MFKYAIALTGGIATGKSTVASLLALHGVRVIDADTISHKILDANCNWVADEFGDRFVKNGKVLRKELGMVVFSDAKIKERLETFLHPLIRIEIEKESIKQDSFQFPYLIDIPLFFEKKSYPIDSSVVVYTTKQIQLERFMKRNGFGKDESLKRIESQLDIELKKEMATWIIDNNSDLKHLQRECEKFVDMLKKRFDAK